MSNAEQRLYDLSLIEEMAQGDEDFMKEVAETFITSVPPVIDALMEHCTNKDWVGMANEAHSLKSNIDTMQINSIRDEIRTIEVNGKQGIQVESMPELVVKVNTVLLKVLAQLKQDYNI